MKNVNERCISIGSAEFVIDGSTYVVNYGVIIADNNKPRVVKLSPYIKRDYAFGDIVANAPFYFDDKGRLLGSLDD